ncbi:unnamed protein product [Paramecium sonneborni]|uniref:Uncharacterized protein n=1 Tax=Paramecium sonneborni TaxID=65129 RepID=A0A8S1LKJ9_9CILI|nr:unnamed protein product [Paramecium sonneborni]
MIYFYDFKYFCIFLIYYSNLLDSYLNQQSKGYRCSRWEINEKTDEQFLKGDGIFIGDIKVEEEQQHKNQEKDEENYKQINKMNSIESSNLFTWQKEPTEWVQLQWQYKVVPRYHFTVELHEEFLKNHLIQIHQPKKLLFYRFVKKYCIVL